MNTRFWSPEEIDKALRLYESGYPWGEIAAIVGRTELSVRLKFLSLGYSTRKLCPKTAVPNRPTLEALRPAPNVEELDDEDYYEERARKELEVGAHRRGERQKVEEAKKAILEDRIVEEFRRHFCAAPPLAAIPAPPPAPSKDRAPLTAVLVVSDAHIGQVVDPLELEGIGNYNPAISLARVRHLEIEAARILRERPVEKLLLLFGGDILHGHLGHTLEDDLTVPIVLQMDFALNIFYPFVYGLSRVVPHLEIHGVAGNHGRWPGMRKMPTDRRWSNLDTILYRALAAICCHSNLGNVTFDERISSRRQIDAGKFRLELLHGDEVRGGAFCTTGMNREVANATLRNVQAGRKTADYFVIGDKHFSASVPFGSGAFIVNGSFVGADGFGMNFLPSPPSQTLFFLHPRLGKTETHEIRLSQAELPEPLPYVLKPNLAELVMHHSNQTQNT